VDVSNPASHPGRADEPPPGETGDPTPAPSRALGEAAAAVRRRLDERWVEISDQIVATAMTARRRTRPVRAEGATGPVFVSDQVIVADLRAAIDDAVRGSAVAHVDPEVHQGERLAGVVIQLVAQYGVPLLPMADTVREIAQQRLAALLGPVPTPVTVRTMRVHYRDVTIDDPNPARQP